METAVVERLIKGKDEIIRGAEVRVITKGKRLRISRPIQKQYPLEIRATLEKNEGVKKTFVSKSDTPRRNPKRAAALDCRWKMRKIDS